MNTVRQSRLVGLWLSALLASGAQAEAPDAVVAAAANVTLGPRPLFLAQTLREHTEAARALKANLVACAADRRHWSRSRLSIAHRGAPLQFPEHTRESYIAAAQMGAGVLECDVTFTADKALVCRHAQCDLHATTNILQTELAAACSVPPAFDPDTGALINAADIRCCTSDITLTEFRTLRGRMEGVDTNARTLDGYLDGTPPWRTDLYSSAGTLMTHAESIELFKALGVKMAPELKRPEVAMPFAGMSREDLAQQLIDAYKAAAVPPDDVYAQSFDLADIEYWIRHEPAFGRQAVYLDGRYRDSAFDPLDATSWSPSMDALAQSGVNVLAPPLWVLLTTEIRDGEAHIVPSPYARAAQAAGLQLIAWTLERTDPRENAPWYHRSIADALVSDGDVLSALDVLVREVGVIGVFSDWPATVTFYANCMQPE